MFSKWSAVIVVGLVFLVLWFLFIDKYEFPELSQLVEDRPDFLFEGLTVSHFNDGELEFEVHAQSASFTRSNNELTLNRSEGVFYVNQQGLMYFNAQTNKFNLESKQWRFYDSYMGYVHKNKLEFWFDSSILNWDGNKGKMYSNEKVSFYSNDFRFRADFFVFDATQRTVLFNRNSMLNFKIDEKK